MIEYTREFMESQLDKFDVSYKYPIVASVIDKTGFFSTQKPRPAFCAVSDRNELLLVEYPAYGLVSNGIEYSLSSLCLKSMKVSKVPLINEYIVSTSFRTEKKTERVKIYAVAGTLNKEFSEQKENVESFIQIMREWKNSI